MAFKFRALLHQGDAQPPPPPPSPLVLLLPRPQSARWGLRAGPERQCASSLRQRAERAGTEQPPEGAAPAWIGGEPGSCWAGKRRDALPPPPPPLDGFRCPRDWVPRGDPDLGRGRCPTTETPSLAKVREKPKRAAIVCFGRCAPTLWLPA